MQNETSRQCQNVDYSEYHINLNPASQFFFSRFLVQTFPFSGTDIPEVNVKNNTSQHLNHSAD